MRSSVLVATLAGALAIALPAAALARPSVAVLGLEVEQAGGGVDAKSSQVARTLTRALREEADKDGGRYQLAPGAAKDLLELKLLSDCSDEGRRCMADIGKELKADFLLYGRVEKLKSGYQITLKLLDTSNAQMVKTTTDLVPTAESRGAALERFGGGLYVRVTGSPDIGSLNVQANVETGMVYVDGELAGNLVDGRAKIEGLPEGVHRVSIVADGHDRYDEEVAITAGREEKMVVSLGADDAVQVMGESESEGDDEGGNPRRKWRTAFWVTTGVTAVGAGLWGYKAYKYSGFWKLLDSEGGPYKRDQTAAINDLNPYLSDPIDANDDGCRDAKQYEDAGNEAVAQAAGRVAKACDRGDRAAKMTAVYGVTTVLTAVAASYFYYRGYAGDAPKDERHTGRRRSPSPAVVLTPAISPTGVGAGLAIEF